MEHIASEFLVSTCRMRTEFNAIASFLFLALNNSKVAGSICRSTVCGSQAEFYIQPINPCIDDLDILDANATFLAFDSSRFEMPECPGDLADMISCIKLDVCEHNKSFVRLGDYVLAAYDWQLEQYCFSNVNLPFLMQPCFGPTSIIGMQEHITSFSSMHGSVTNESEQNMDTITAQGPAMKNILLYPNILNITQDLVHSIRCLSWPLVAESWPKRERHSGWPNSATIAKVINKGCDVVQVKHRDMQEELNQWRFSFSRAEVSLIRSWTRTQQIVYHLLRFFAKREIIRKNCPKKEEVVCTYHLKTLMLWSCEEESTEWWETSSVVSICCKILGKLCECLKRKHCPNYFIPEANLLDQEMSSEVLNRTIAAVDYYKDVHRMSNWFTKNYILPVFRRLFDQNENVLTEEKVQRCMISVCEYNEKHQLNDIDMAIFICALRCFKAMVCAYNFHWTNKHLLKTGDLEMPVKSIIDTSFASQLHRTLADYMTALILFQMSQFILSSKKECYVEVVCEIWTHIIRQSHFVESPDSMHPFGVKQKSMLYFNRSEQVMKHLAFGYSKNESSFAKIVSMLCLHKSLCCRDTSSSKTKTASRIYLAALFYYNGDLQCAVHLCSEVATSLKENYKCREIRYLKLDSLRFIDDLATIAGFLQLRRDILRIPDTGIFLLSPELILLYIFIQCNPERLELKETFKTPLSFEADCCLAAMMRYKMLRRFVSKIPQTRNYQRCTEHAEESTTGVVLPGKPEIAEALVNISNDCMARFYTSLREELGSKFDLALCYEALSLYLCRRYEDVLGLCETLLEDSEYNADIEVFQFLNVNVSFYFMAYFDEDIQALAGFQILVVHFSWMQHNIFKNILKDDRITQSMLAINTFYNIFKPILRKKFLGNYLKLRCLLDLGFPVLEVKSAFRCLEGRFLFEHTLVYFMRHKIILMLQRNK